MVAQAPRSRACIQRLAGLVAGYFHSIMIAVAVIALEAWAIFGHYPRLALVAAEAVLLIVCLYARPASSTNGVKP